MMRASFLSWLPLLVAEPVDWIAWLGSESQGPPSPSGGWKKIDRSERFQGFPWEQKQGTINGYRYFFPKATQYTVGNSSGEKIEVWQPFKEYRHGVSSAVCANIRGALFNLYQHNLSSVHITVKNVGWDAVAKKPICQPNASCPNLILLGSSQMANRVVTGRVHALDLFMEQYLWEKMVRLQDDITSSAYYQYFFNGKWMGIPFLTDVRLLAFNKTTLENINISAPPSITSKEEATWSWLDLRRDACKIKEASGHAGLLANSDFDEDFKFFTLMVQSGGGSMYGPMLGDGQLQCGLNSPRAVEMLENWWTPMIREGCLFGRNGRGYWTNMTSGDLLLEELLTKEINPVDPMDVSGFSSWEYEDLVRPYDHVPGFTFVNGLLERFTVGSCSLYEKSWPYNSSWAPNCTGGPETPDVNLTRCKDIMLEQGYNSLIFENGTCHLKRCNNIAEAMKLYYVRKELSRKVEVHSHHCSEILFADMPENHTFLGGSGLIIPKQALDPGDSAVCDDLQADCRRKRHGWRMVVELISNKNPWMAQANLLKGQSVPPPRRHMPALEAQNPHWAPVLRAITENGIPSQYPNLPIPTHAEIEAIKPVRIAMIRNILGNVSAQTALDSTCDIMHELVRTCDPDRWDTDERCVNPLDGLQGCEAGMHLSEAHFGYVTCSACEMGLYLPERSVAKVCKPCPAGTYSDKLGSSSCTPCPAGLVAFKGAHMCFNCSAGQQPFGGICSDCQAGTYEEDYQCLPCASGLTSLPKSSGKEFCLPKRELIWLNLLIMLDFILMILLLPHFCGRPVAVHDIYLDEGKLVLKTWGFHQVSRFSCMPPIKIGLKGTKHFLLEENGAGRTFLVKWLAPDELYLLNNKGMHITDDINSSSGHMWILPRCSLWGSSICKIPASIVMLVLMVIMAFCVAAGVENGVAEMMHLPWTVGACVGGAIVSLVIYAVAWHSWVSKTPLERRRRVFRKRLLKANPSPTESERGAGRAVTAEQISDLFEYFRDFIGVRNMHYVTNNLIIPFTKPWQLSYADLAGPSLTQWFVSHCWNNAFEDFILSLKKMAEGKTRTGNWQDVSFWICSFSNNQFKVKEELGNGDPLHSSFYMALQSLGCQGTAMVLDNDCTPLKRSWCLFELLQTRYVAPKTKQDHEGLLLCTPMGVLQWGEADVDTVMRLAEKVGETRLENATASSREDKIMIDKCVIETVKGGFTEVNNFVHTSIKSLLDEANETFQLRVKELMLKLDREGSPQEKRYLLKRSSATLVDTGKPKTGRSSLRAVTEWVRARAAPEKLPDP